MNNLPLLGVVLMVLLSACDRPQYALGSLEWDRVNGRAIASEAITELYVEEGEQVEQGQALLTLDSGLQQSKVIQTQARLEQLQWQLKELKAGYRVEQIAAAEAEHTAAVSARKNRAVEYRRLSELIVNKLTSQRNLDLARTALDQAVGKEEAALERLTELKAGYRTEQIAAAEAEFEAEAAVLSYEKQLLERYTVVAERDGVLESFPFKLGDKPPAGAVVSTVLSGAKPWARVYLPETWLSQVEIGTLVNVRVDGRSEPLEGRIRHIESRSSFTPYYALAEEDRKRLSYVTEIDLVDQAALNLPVGIPVQVSLKPVQ